MEIVKNQGVWTEAVLQRLLLHQKKPLIGKKLLPT